MAIVFVMIVSMLNDFIKKAVDIAVKIEDEIKIPQHLRITGTFERNWLAGERGERITWLFNAASFTVTVASAVFGLFCAGKLTPV